MLAARLTTPRAQAQTHNEVWSRLDVLSKFCSQETFHIKVNYRHFNLPGKVNAAEPGRKEEEQGKERKEEEGNLRKGAKKCQRGVKRRKMQERLRKTENGGGAPARHIKAPRALVWGEAGGEIKIRIRYCRAGARVRPRGRIRFALIRKGDAASKARSLMESRQGRDKGARVRRSAPIAAIHEKKKKKNKKT
ncbi:hypothetical protein F2P81_008418 [Scophthalmus maximus]|uniref:Uncharacterized protein n=1 Tax=Scophthalmus maximus TaxID=52904 RepID=A0A6A4T295_SCOMX|nr:hypothetical protein F2P81_008418 [Scophthalmus maximus]